MVKEVRVINFVGPFVRIFGEVERRNVEDSGPFGGVSVCSKVWRTHEFIS